MMTSSALSADRMTSPQYKWTPPPWFLWLMRLLRHPSMKPTKTTKLSSYPPQQQFLFRCMAKAMEYANERTSLTHADHLIVLEAYRDAITEDWIDTHPEMVPYFSKLLRKE